VVKLVYKVGKNFYSRRNALFTFNSSQDYSECCRWLVGRYRTGNNQL